MYPDFVIRKYIQAEEDLLKQVLTSLLKREPTILDATKVHRKFYGGEHESYILAYEGVDLGVVKYNYPCPSNADYSLMAGITFTPNEKFS